MRYTTTFYARLSFNRHFAISSGFQTNKRWFQKRFLFCPISHNEILVNSSWAGRYVSLRGFALGKRVPQTKPPSGGQANFFFLFCLERVSGFIKPFFPVRSLFDYVLCLSERTILLSPFRLICRYVQSGFRDLIRFFNNKTQVFRNVLFLVHACFKNYIWRISSWTGRYAVAWGRALGDRILQTKPPSRGQVDYYLFVLSFEGWTVSSNRFPGTGRARLSRPSSRMGFSRRWVFIPIHSLRDICFIDFIRCFSFFLFLFLEWFHNTVLRTKNEPKGFSERSEESPAHARKAS